MLLDRLIRENDLDESFVAEFLNDHDEFKVTTNFFNEYKLSDADVPAILQGLNEKKLKIEDPNGIKKKEELFKSQKLSRILITSGFNFDGYRVSKYSGYISGDDVIQVDRGQGGIFSSATNVGDALMENLSEVRRNALTELKEKAYALGCNAIIGVDFDYLTLEPETVSATGGTLYMPYVFGVTANGNAVIIEENK